MRIKANRFLELRLSLSVESLRGCDKKPIEIQTHLLSSEAQTTARPDGTSRGIHRSLGIKNLPLTSLF